MDRESLAVETIAQAGPGGHFMGSKHTRRHMREVQWRPSILNRQGRDNWLADGGLDLAAKARLKAIDLLATHEVPALPPHVAAEADRLIADVRCARRTEAGQGLLMHVAIVGNSAAALSALESFRERDLTSSVTLVSEEAGPAYSRVLLPYYLRRKLSYDGLFIRRMEDYARLRAATEFGARVERVDPATRQLEFADGRRLGFDRLLLATGSSPARPPIPGLDGPGVHTLWSLDDAVRLDPVFRDGARVMVLGSGFVALQAAWAATQRGLQVTVVGTAGSDPASRAGRGGGAGPPRTTRGARRGRPHGHAHRRPRDGSSRHGARLDQGASPFTVDAVIVGDRARAPTTGCCRSAWSRASRASRWPTPWRRAWTASSPPGT